MSNLQVAAGLARLGTETAFEVLARANEAILTQQQSNAAITDAATVFLVLIPVSSLTGQNVEGDLATAKGTVDALESRLIGC